jgi:uncharacterized membrane protein
MIQYTRAGFQLGCQVGLAVCNWLLAEEMFRAIFCVGVHIIGDMLVVSDTLADKLIL